MDQDDDIYSGFTQNGAALALTSVLTTISHAKLHIGPAYDGTLEPSVFSTRVAATFGPPDNNTLADLAASFTFTGLTAIEDGWGVSFWTASTAGLCRLVRRFTEMKHYFVGDNLTVVSAPITIPSVGI